MSKSDQRDSEKRIQTALVHRVRDAGRDYDSASAPLASYVAALEALAAYVGARCQKQRQVLQFPAGKRPSLPLQRPASKPPNSGRIIPFAPPSYSDRSPYPAA